MKILTVENKSYELDTLPEEIDDVRYCVLEAGQKEEVDFYFLPLIFLESFHAPAICLNIGGKSVQMPMDWSIMICDEDCASVEVIPLASLNNRGFKALTMNPLQNLSLQYDDIVITNIFQDVKWYVPRLKNGHLLAIPIEDKPEPRCAYFVKDANKIAGFDVGELI